MWMHLINNMREIKTFCDYHLGDNLIHLNFFRRLAVANPNSNFIHAAPAEQVWQLKKVVSDLGNCRVVGGVETRKIINRKFSQNI